MTEQWHELGRELIGKVGGEGCSVTCFRIFLEDGPRGFVVETNQGGMAIFLEEDLLEGLKLVKKSEVASTFDDGRKCLDVYYWPALYPLYVHMEFRDRTHADVAIRLPGDGASDKLATWERVLAGGRADD